MSNKQNDEYFEHLAELYEENPELFREKVMENAEIYRKGIIETADEINYQLDNLKEEVSNIKKFVNEIQ